MRLDEMMLLFILIYSYNTSRLKSTVLTTQSPSSRKLCSSMKINRFQSHLIHAIKIRDLFLRIIWKEQIFNFVFSKVLLYSLNNFLISRFLFSTFELVFEFSLILVN